MVHETVAAKEAPELSLYAFAALQTGGWHRKQHRQKQVHQNLLDGTLSGVWQH